MKVMKIERLVLLTGLLVSSVAHADGLFEENGNVAEARRARCNDLKMRNPSPERCARSAAIAYNNGHGCINHEEMKKAEALGLMVVCDPTDSEYIMFGCPCACFDEGVNILTQKASGAQDWLPAERVNEGSALVALADDARRQSLAFVSRGVRYTTHGPEIPDLYLISTQGHATLRVTQNHAILLHDGRVTTAKEVHDGDLIMSSSGDAAVITGISRAPAKGEVYNFLAAGESKASHLIVAEGLVVGDLLWQNSLGLELNQVALRE